MAHAHSHVTENLQIESETGKLGIQIIATLIGGMMLVCSFVAQMLFENDFYPTVLEALGVALTEEDSFPGRSLWAIAGESDQDRTVFSEYHAVASRAGFYMLRDRRYKFIYYVGAPPQLFDLAEDPLEINDLAGSPEFLPLRGEFEGRLRQILDPEQVDARAKADQMRAVETHGGSKAVIERGAFDNSPVPGEDPKFH